MVFADQVKNILRKYASFDESNFTSTSLTWTIKNAKFNEDFLQMIDLTSELPIYVKESHIGEIFISSTYSLRINKVSIKDVIILAVPNTKEHNARQRDNYGDNLLYKLDQAGTWSQYFSDSLAKYITTGLEVSIDGIRFRYEEVRPSSCCVDLVVDRVYVKYESGGSTLDIGGISVFVHPDVAEDGFYAEHPDWRKRMASGRGDADAVVWDVSARITSRDAGSGDATDYNLALTAGRSPWSEAARPGALEVRVRAAQLRAVGSVLDTWRFLLVQEVHWHYRPPSHVRPRGKANCREWWLYAFNVVRETKLFPFQFERIKKYRRFYSEYIRNFKIVNTEADNVKALEAQRRLRELSRVLNRTSIVLAREEALAKLESEAVALTDSDFTESARVGVMNLAAKLPDVCLALCEEARPRLRAVVSGLELRYRTVPLEALTSLSVALDDGVTEFALDGGAGWLRVVSAVEPAGETDGRPLVSATIESRVGVPSTQALRIHMRPTRANLYQPTVACMSRALAEMSAAGGGGGGTLARAGLVYTEQLASAVFPASSVLSWELDVRNPQLLLSEWGARDRDGAVLLFDLGHLKSTSNCAEYLSGDVLGVNHATVSDIQIVFADSKSKLESILRKEQDEFFLLPSSIDLRLLNLSSGRQRLELAVSPLQLQAEKLNSISRLLVHAGFLGHSSSSSPPGPLRTRFQQALELQLRQALRTESSVAEMRELARELRSSRSQRQSQNRRAKLTPEYKELLRKHSIQSSGRVGLMLGVGERRTHKVGRVVGATAVSDLATERNRLRWELALTAAEVCAAVEMGGELVLRLTQTRLECGALEYGLGGLLEVAGLECSWGNRGRRVDLLRRGDSDPDLPMCHLVFLDLQPNCPRFQADYGSVRTTVAANLGSLAMHVDQEAVTDIIGAAQTFYERLHEYISEVPESVDLLSREISRAFNGLIRQNDDMEAEMLRRKSTVVRLHAEVRVRALAVALSMGGGRETVFAHADLKQLRTEARVHRHWTRYKCELQDCLVENRTLGALYRCILKRSSESAAPQEKLLQATVLRNLRPQASGSGDNASLRMNRVDIVCLPDFVKDLQDFVGPFGRQIAEFSRRMSERARAELINVSKSKRHLELKLKMPSPRFVVPIGAQTEAVFILRLGDLQMENEDRQGQPGDSFTVNLDAVQLTRALMRDDKVVRSADIFRSEELADVKLIRDTEKQKFSLSLKTETMEPKITPLDYRNLLKVLDSWKSSTDKSKKSKENTFDINLVDFETPPAEQEESTDEEEEGWEVDDVAWTFNGEARISDIIVDINDFRAGADEFIDDEDLVPIGQLKMSELHVSLDIDATGNYTMDARWEGLSLCDRRLVRSNPHDRLVSICEKQARLNYGSVEDLNTVDLTLTDMEIYADIFYFRNLVRMFADQDEQQSADPDSLESLDTEPWSRGEWNINVCGANLILHCLSEVEGDADLRFLDVQLMIRDEADTETPPWKFYFSPTKSKSYLNILVGIDFGYLDNLFCKVLDPTNISFQYEIDDDSEKIAIAVKRCQADQADQTESWIGLNVSPLLLLHVQKIMQTFMSPVPRMKDIPGSRRSSRSSSPRPQSPNKPLVMSGLLRHPKGDEVDHTTPKDGLVDGQDFSLNDVDEEMWQIGHEKLPAVKQFPSAPELKTQEMNVEFDPVRLCFHMNVNDPVVRLDLGIRDFEVNNWRSEINVQVGQLQMAVFSFNDEEQDWEALVEKLAVEENGVPFENTPDNFQMWSCALSLCKRPSKVLGDQTLRELMEDTTYHGQQPDEDEQTDHDGPPLRRHDQESPPEGSIEDLARALEEESCYYLQVLSLRKARSTAHPLLINYSPSTAKRIAEISQCFSSILEGKADLPDRRLIPTLRIENDTGREMKVWVDTDGQIVDPVNCELSEDLRRVSGDMHGGSMSNTYNVYIQVKGYERIICKVGRHSRISMRSLTPAASERPGVQPAVEPHHVLVQTDTDLALAKVRITSGYFVENKLELPLLAIIHEDMEPVELPAMKEFPLPLGTKDSIKLTMPSKCYEMIDCDLNQSTTHEHLELKSTDESQAPTCYFMKTIASVDMRMTMTLDAFIRINNFLPYPIRIGFAKAERADMEIGRGKHAFLSMFSQSESLDLTITVVGYQEQNWRCSYVMKSTVSKSVRRLRLDEIPSQTLQRNSFRTGRFITIASRRTAESDCRVMHLFAPLWIVNDKTKVAWQIKERRNPAVTLPPGDEPAMFTPKHVASTSQWHQCNLKMCGLTEAVHEGAVAVQWSQRIDVGAVCKTVALTVPRTQKVAEGHRMTDGWMLLLRIEQLPFTYSRLVTILPRYVLQNRTSHSIYFLEEAEGGTDDDEYCLAPGETVPFWPRGTSLKGRVRRTLVGRFSKPFAYNEVQSTALKVSEEWAVVVEVTGGVSLKPMVISFRRYRRGDAPLRVENFCARRNVVVRQTGGREVLVPSFKYTVYLWDNPCALRELRCAVIGSCEETCVCQKEFDVLVTSNRAGCIECVKGKVYWISFIHENQRTLLVTDKSSLYRRVQSLSQAEPMSLWVQLRLDEVGVSFIADHREIAFLSISGTAKANKGRFPGLFAMYQCARKNRLLHLRVSQFRLFNSLRNPIYREVLYDRPDEARPFLDFGVKWRIASSKCGQAIDTLRIKLSTIIANIDFGFAMSLYGAFVAPNEPTEEIPEASVKILDEQLGGTEMNIKRQTLRELANMNEGEQEQEYLFREAVMESFNLRLSLSGDGKVHGAYEPSVRAYSILAPLVGSLFSQKDTCLSVSELQRCGLSMPVGSFVGEVVNHCKSSLLQQVYMLLLGVDIFGDPITLYHTVTEGFRAEEPDDDDEEEEVPPDDASSQLSIAQPSLGNSRASVVRPRVQRQARQGARGVRRVRTSGISRRRRVTKVVRHVGGGVANSVAQFTCAIGRIVSKATFDPAFIQERRERFHRAIEPSDCGREAAISLVKGVGAGAFGVVYRPIKGAKKSGFGGGVRGLGRGVIGIPTRPIVGTLDAASLSAEALKRLALQDHFSYPEGRRPRACVRKTFVYFSEWEANGQKLLFTIDEEKFEVENGHRYRAHIMFGSRKKKAIFVTETALIKAKKIFDYKWRSCWIIQLPFIRSVESNALSNPKSSGQIQDAITIKYGKNEEDRRRKLIFLPDNKCHPRCRPYLKAAIEAATQDKVNRDHHDHTIRR